MSSEVEVGDSKERRISGKSVNETIRLMGAASQRHKVQGTRHKKGKRRKAEGSKKKLKGKGGKDN